MAGRRFGREFNLSLKDIKSFYNKYLVWLGRQDSNLGSRKQSPLPYRIFCSSYCRLETGGPLVC